MKRMTILLACLALSACTTTNTKTATASLITPSKSARVLVIQPDVDLRILTMAGLPEARADWTQQGRDNLDAEIQKSLSAGEHPIKALDASTAMDGHNGQMLRLHEVVGQSILAFSYGYIALPTKKGAFDWTLGEGAQSLGQTYDADFALFTYARGSYSSGGRVAAMIALAAVGVSVPTGGQQVFASLVDLKTGRIVWFNLATAGPSADMRTPAGAHELVASLLKGAPL
jgi:hypothetical protein